MNYYSNFNQPYNQFYGQPMQQVVQQVPKTQPMEQQYAPQFIQQPMYKSQLGLQGKSVDNIEVVKATDIPLDGSISYFPLTDGTAIVTKQLKPDGTSDTRIYKLVDNNEVVSTPNYITQEDFNEKVKALSNDGIKDEMKEMKRKIEDIQDDIKKIKKG